MSETSAIRQMANLNGRVLVLSDDRYWDVERESGGRLPSSPAALFEQWDAFENWLEGAVLSRGAVLESARFAAPSPTPRQVFALGLNYLEHARETGFIKPAHPIVFTKFASSIAGDHSVLQLSSDLVDWEVELVVVIGRGGRDIPEDRAWHHIAGLTVGLDISDRLLQFEGESPQWSLAKSFAAYSPLGPTMLLTPHEPEPLFDVECRVNGEVVQKATSDQLIFGIAETVAYLSSVCELLPGDVIFTGTPSGVGMAMNPPRYLKAGDRIEGSISGVGVLHAVCEE